MTQQRGKGWAAALLAAALAMAGIGPAAVPAPAALAAGGVSFALDPAQQTVPPGEEFTLTVTVAAGDQPVDAVQADVTFPADLLEVVDADATRSGIQAALAGPFTLVLVNQVDSALGRVSYAAGHNPGQPPAAGSFPLAHLKFRARAAGTASVRFAATTEAAGLGAPLPVTAQGATVTVVAAPAAAAPPASAPQAAAVTPATSAPVPSLDAAVSSAAGSPVPAALPRTGDAPASVTAAPVTAEDNGVTATVLGAAPGLSIRLAAAALPALAPAPQGTYPAGRVFSLSVAGAGGAPAALGAGADLTVPYIGEDMRLAGGDLIRLRLLRYDEAMRAWEDLLATADPSARVLRARVDRPGLFAVMAELPLPSSLSGPSGGATAGPEKALTWVNPPGARQFQIQVMPFNGDGPAINLTVAQPDQVQAARFAITSAVAGSSLSGLAPGRSYVWRVRTSPLTAPLGPQESGWSGWAVGLFRSAAPAS